MLRSRYRSIREHVSGIQILSNNAIAFSLGLSFYDGENRFQ